MNQQQQNAIKAMAEAAKLCKAANVNVVFATATYTTEHKANEKQDAYFSTHMSVADQMSAGVSENHIVLDLLREIMCNWSNANHHSQLTWTEGK